MTKRVHIHLERQRESGKVKAGYKYKNMENHFRVAA